MDLHLWKVIDLHLAVEMLLGQLNWKVDLIQMETGLYLAVSKPMEQLNLMVGLIQMAPDCC